MNITQKIRNRVSRRKLARSVNIKKYINPDNRINGHIPTRLIGIINTRKNRNKNKRTFVPYVILNLEREFNFHVCLKGLNEKYGPKRIMDWYWTPSTITNGLPDLVDDENDEEFKHDLRSIHRYLNPRYSKTKLESKEMLNYFVEQVEIITDKIIKKYPALKDITEVERYALFRYWTVGALNNISLSVSPETKREWGINFELFGAFYNTDNEYCGLYSELEKRCICDVLNFKLRPNMTILVNPPYTEKWIEKSCELVNKYLEQNINTTIWLVVPVWNTLDRKILGLKIYNDMPILDAMKHSPYLISHEIKKLKFYNGLEKKHVNLKDHVHVYHLSNSSSIF